MIDGGVYGYQIKRLELLIENWYDIKTPEDFYKIFGDKGKKHNIHSFGLCATCKLGYEIYDMFPEWEYFSNVFDFPVGGYWEYENLKLITDNPKRLHLAVHCLRYLREHNEERGNVHIR